MMLSVVDVERKKGVSTVDLYQSSFTYACQTHGISSVHTESVAPKLSFLAKDRGSRVTLCECLIGLITRLLPGPYAYFQLLAEIHVR